MKKLEGIRNRLIEHYKTVKGNDIPEEVVADFDLELIMRHNTADFW